MRRLLFCVALVVSLFCFWKAVSVDAAGTDKKQATPDKQQAERQRRQASPIPLILSGQRPARPVTQR